ncbi:MAG: discoidin domain-containing protein [Oscillospiraceae bacterium]|nr:discoidin domain-containing protein [Oscillospiraceae bacterium]
MKIKCSKKIISSLLLAAMIMSSFVFAARAASEVQGVVLDKSNVALMAGDTVTFTATILPTDADNKAVRFASSNPYLTLSAPLYDPATGETSVTVETTRNCSGKIVAITDDGGKIAICDVTVGDSLDPGEMRNRALEAGVVLSGSGNNPAGEEVDKAFDNRQNTKWLTRSNTGWLQVQFPKRYYITKYSIVSGGSALSDRRIPKDWILWASNDGVDWDKLDEQTDQEFSAQYLKRIYNIDLDKARAYQYYKLEITANNGSVDIVELAEWELFELGPAQPWALGPFEKLDDFNPILRPNNDVFYCPVTQGNISWTNLSLYNPGAIMKDGVIHLFYRAQDNSSGRTSRVGLATSTDGTTFERHPVPVVYPDNTYNNYEWRGGCEDPRIIQSPDGKYFMYYTGYDGGTARLMVASSTDLINWVKHGLAFNNAGNGKYRNTWSKSGAVVCEMVDGVQIAKMINGKYWMYWGESGMYCATSDDLADWYPVENSDGSLRAMLGTRRGNFDSSLCEPGPQAIYSEDGIVLIYNGKNSNPNNGSGDPMILDGSYCPGQALFDKNDPARMIDRTPTYFMNPEKDYEVYGLVGKVCFIEGLVFKDGIWYLYYGTADSYLAVAVYDPAKWEAKPKENTLSLDNYDLSFYSNQKQKLTATATLDGGIPGAEVQFISTNSDIVISNIAYDPVTGQTTADVTSQIGAEGMIIAVAGDEGSRDAMICNVNIKKAYNMTGSFISGGKTITQKTDGEIAFEVNFESNVDTTLDINVMIALYKKGLMIDMKTAAGPFQLNNGANVVATPPITIASLDGIEDYVVKGFIWDENYIPLTGAYVLDEWSPPNPNLALKRPCEASSYAGDGPTFNSNDGNMGTYWTAAQNSSGDIWYEVDLGFVAKIDRVVIRWGSPYVSNFRIETAAVKGSYTTARSVTGGNGGDQTIDIDPVDARYVRFYYPSTGSGYRVRIYEFEVYGVVLAPGDIKLMRPYDVDASWGTPITVIAEPYGYFGEGVTLSASGLPAGSSFDASSGVFTWTPEKEQIGTHEITFHVTNGVTEDSKTFLINVTAVNLALGKTASASSTDSSDHPARAAIDGDLGTRWASSSSNNQWLMVDLGSNMEVSRVILRWEAAYGRTYRIEYATAAAPNTWLVATENNNGQGGVETLDFSPVTARYVRFYGLTRATSWGFSLFEFEIF